MFTDLEVLQQICTKNQNNKKIKTQKKKRRKTNLDVEQCVNDRWVLSLRVSEIESLGLQKLVVVVAMGFFGVPFPSFMLLLVMVVVVHVVATVQEQEKKLKKIAIQEHKKPIRKKNPKNSKLGRRENKKNLLLSTLSNKKQIFQN